MESYVASGVAYCTMRVACSNGARQPLWFGNSAIVEAVRDMISQRLAATLSWSENSKRAALDVPH